MKTQINQFRQSLLLAIIIVLGASVSTFALESKTNNNFLTFDRLSSNANQSSLFETRKAFDSLNVQSNDLFAADFKTVADYPKPDFSEIEKWYEVIKYEYGDFEGGDNTLYFTLKPKSDNLPNFFVYFYDKDGAKVQGPNAALCWECSPRDPIGTVQKYHAIAPTETNMKSVAAVKMVRQKN